jgi:hypothetical protein
MIVDHYEPERAAGRSAGGLGTVVVFNGVHDRRRSVRGADRRFQAM